MNSSYSGLLILIVLMGCSPKKSNEEILVGSWEALWLTDPASYPELKSVKKFTMNGFIEFSNDGKMSINAYGYPDCIFSVDTMRHQLNWKLKNDTIHFISDEDTYGIPYRINEISENQVQLQLMEDISLTLIRAN